MKLSTTEISFIVLAGMGATGMAILIGICVSKGMTANSNNEATGKGEGSSCVISNECSGNLICQERVCKNLSYSTPATNHTPPAATIGFKQEDVAKVEAYTERRIKEQLDEKLGALLHERATVHIHLILESPLEMTGTEDITFGDMPFAYFHHCSATLSADGSGKITWYCEEESR
jgi:hypothetical protein